MIACKVDFSAFLARFPEDERGAEGESLEKVKAQHRGHLEYISFNLVVVNKDKKPYSPDIKIAMVSNISDPGQC